MPEYATLEKVYQDMKHGVYNFTNNGKCKKLYFRWEQ
jgi:hypothetical protein